MDALEEYGHEIGLLVWFFYRIETVSTFCWYNLCTMLKCFLFVVLFIY